MVNSSSSIDDNMLTKSTTIIVCFYPIITFIGVIGNLLSFKIFSRKKFENTVFSTYFRFLTLADTLTLVLPLNKFLELNLNIYIQNMSEYLCKYRMYMTYVIPPISGWTLALISLDRLISIVKPTQFLFRKNQLFQHILCASIMAFNVFYYLPILFASKFKIDDQQSDDDDNDKLTNKTVFFCEFNSINYLYWMDLFNSVLLPFTFMLTFTILTVRALFKSRNKTNKTNQNQDKRICSKKKKKTKNNTNKNDMKFAITTVTLNLIFLILNIPFCLYVVIYEYVKVKIDHDMDNLIFSITLLIYYINFSSVFFINVIVNSLFKVEFYSLFGLKLKKKRSTSLTIINQPFPV
jgi:hypothetical protein